VSLSNGTHFLHLDSGISKLALCGIGGLTLYLFYPPLTWLWHQLAIDISNVMIILVLPLVWFLRPQTLRQQKSLHFPIAASLMYWICIVAYLANENYLGVNILSTALCFGALYGIYGFISTERQWRALFLPFCLIVMLLPFEGYLDIYLGFPLRLLCADLAGEILGALGFASVSNESLILIEEKVANVELGCSGIKGIWAGGIFFLLLSLIEGHRVTWRWFAIGMCFIGCLLMANVLRIVLLVLLGVVADYPSLAHYVHQAIGLIGFSLSCIFAWGALRFSRRETSPEETNAVLSNIRNQALPLSIQIPSLFIGGLLLALWLHNPLQASATLTSLNSLNPDLPKVLSPSVIELSDLEQTFFTNNHASVIKRRFNLEGTTGSVLIVSSRYWKAQHEPHNCYLGQGYSLGFEGTWFLSNDNTVRFLQINNASKTAVYWFQSEDHITADYSARVLKGLLNPQDTWLMVSVLFDQARSQIQSEALLLEIQQHLAETLMKEGSNE